MRTLLLVPIVSLLACSGSDDADPSTTDPAITGCGYDTYDQIRGADNLDLDIPETEEGALEDVIIGVWQHVFVMQEGQPLNDVSDNYADIRFAIPDTTTFIYCQDVSADVDGTNGRALEIVGNKLDIPGAGYTATAWRDDVMVWRNDYWDDRDEYYVLVRMD